LALEDSTKAEALAERMLAEAYELVRSGWCQGATAQDELGRPIEPSSAFARRWSAAGALERVWRRTLDDDGFALEAFERANLALAAAVKDVPQRWNDAADRSCAEVLDALQGALQLVRISGEVPQTPVKDLVDDLRYEAIPGSLFERSA
jgi:hypothetical protein